jgi:hypothetical protein
MIDDLERRLESGECSDELREALTQQHGDPAKSIIERYRDILKWNIEDMAVAYKNGGYSYIDNIHKPMIDGVGYRNVGNPSGASLTRGELANLPTDGSFALSPAVSADGSRAGYFGSFPDGSVTYRMLPGFLRFSEHPGRNREFFEELSAMMNQPAIPPIKLYDDQEDAEGGDAEAQQRGLINSVLEFVNIAYVGLTNSPLGASSISDSETPGVDRLDMLGIVSMLPEALSLPVLGMIQDPLASMAGMGDYLLLLTYSTTLIA